MPSTRGSRSTSTWCRRTSKQVGQVAAMVNGARCVVREVGQRNAARTREAERAGQACFSGELSRGICSGQWEAKSQERSVCFLCVPEQTGRSFLDPASHRCSGKRNKRCSWWQTGGVAGETAAGNAARTPLARRMASVAGERAACVSERFSRAMLSCAWTGRPAYLSCGVCNGLLRSATEGRGFRVSLWQEGHRPGPDMWF
jgi:hypothetical protein